MVASLIFLEGEEREVHLARERQARFPRRTLASHLAYQRALLASDWARRSWRVAALRGGSGELATTASLLDLRFRLGGKSLRLAGLASLVVPPRLRGLGAGRVLLEHLHEHLAQEGYDGVLAFSSSGNAWYASAGYERVPLAALEARLEGWREAGPAWPAHSSVRPFEPRDFEAVRELFNTSSSLQSFALLRDDLYWEFVMRRWELAASMLPDERHALLVGEHEGRVVSYLRALGRRDGRQIAVLEYATEAGASADLTSLARAAIEAVGSGDAPLLRSVVPTRFKNFLPAASSRWSPERRNVLLVRPLTAFHLPSDSIQDERMLWGADRF